MLGKIFKSAVKIIKLPVAIAADVVTLGAAKTRDNNKTFTKQTIDEIEESLDEII